LLEEALRGSGIRQNVVAQKITRTIPPEQLAALARDGEHHTIIDRGDLNPDQASKLVEAFRGPVRLAQLLTAELRDNPRIELLDGGTYRIQRRYRPGKNARRSCRSSCSKVRTRCSSTSPRTPRA
jgi:hypothetical protein